jgi:hypothetical protein
MRLRKMYRLLLRRKIFEKVLLQPRWIGLECEAKGLQRCLADLAGF